MLPNRAHAKRRNPTLRLGAVAVAMVTVGAAVTIGGCGSDESAVVRRAELTQGCSLNSECVAPLACVFQKCHTECKETRDCPSGQRCVAGDRPFRVCQLPEETACRGRSDCPVGKKCGPDQTCRDECSVDVDCGTGQKCRSAVCAEAAELVGDKLPATSSDSTVAGQTCGHAEDCPGVQICVRGFCEFECISNKDCFVSWTCAGNRCTPPDGGH